MLNDIIIAVKEIAAHHQTIPSALITVLRPHRQLVDLHGQTVQVYIARLHFGVGRVMKFIPDLF
ncbi:hypothetical protein D3C81_1223040 [compost metagenome]